MLREKLNLITRKHIAIANDLFFRFTKGKHLRKFHNKYRGEHCFIIGNGPSLRLMNLEHLSRFFTFGLNNIFLHDDFDKLNLKFYISGNPIFIKSAFFEKYVLPTLLQYSQTTKFFDYDFSQNVRGRIELLTNVYYLKFNQNQGIRATGRMSFDITKSLPSADGVTVLIQAAIPLAVYMGFKVVYLIGCDCSINVGRVDCNHFYRESGNVLLKELVQRANSLYGERFWKRTDYNTTIIEGWRIVKQYMDNLGIKVYNCGINSRLKIFPQLDYEKVVKGL